VLCVCVCVCSSVPRRSQRQKSHHPYITLDGLQVARRSHSSSDGLGVLNLGTVSVTRNIGRDTEEGARKRKHGPGLPPSFIIDARCHGRRGISRLSVSSKQTHEDGFKKKRAYLSWLSGFSIQMQLYPCWLCWTQHAVCWFNQQTHKERGKALTGTTSSTGVASRGMDLRRSPTLYPCFCHDKLHQR